MPKIVSTGDTIEKTLATATATGAGTVHYTGAARSIFGLQVTVTGAPTACLVNLEGSLDYNPATRTGTWFVLQKWDITTPQASGDIVFTSLKPVIAWRGNLTALSGGASPTVSAWISAD